MTTTISPDQYCQNPQDYANYPGITSTTRAYWDQYCAAKKQVQNTPMPPSNSMANASAIGIQNFLEAFIQPQSLEILAGVVGGMITYWGVKTALTSLLKNGLDKSITDAAEAFIKEGGDAAVANGASLVTKLFGEMTQVQVEEAGLGGRYAVAELVDNAEDLGKIISDFFGPIGDAMLALQIISSIFDAWDPCNLNIMMDANALSLFTQEFNDQFRENVLVSLESSQDSYGNITLNSEWPVEYYAEQSALVPYKNDYYNPIQQKLFMQYMNSLQFNSNGDPIFYSGPGRVITNKDIQGIELTAFGLFGNNNTVLENWLIKWWPLLLGVLILVVGGIFFLTRKKGQIPKIES